MVGEYVGTYLSGHVAYSDVIVSVGVVSALADEGTAGPVVEDQKHGKSRPK